MATYTYRCSYCAEETTVEHSIGTATPKVLSGDDGCDTCGGPRRRVYNWRGATQLKGDGWASKRGR